MSGYFAAGRLQDAEWLMRGCVIINDDLPAHAPEFTPDTPINKAYTQQAAEFEVLLAKLDPEGDIDPAKLPSVAFFNPAERWPIDIILGAGLALLVFLFLPNWYGVGEFVAYVLILAYVAVQYLSARQKREREEKYMRRLGMMPGQIYPLTLRQLVKFRRPPGAPDNVTLH